MVYYLAQMFKNSRSAKRLSSFTMFTSLLRHSSHKTHSSLLISGQRAEDTFVVVIPHLDFDHRFNNFSQLDENIKRRKLNLNLTEMKESWDFYKDWNDKKLKLQENLNESGKRLSKVLNLEDNEEKFKEKDKLERYRKIIKDELQDVKKNVWSLEDTVICELLSLPNNLHPQVPDTEEQISSFDKESIDQSFSHLQAGVELNCLEYRNRQNYFLRNEAALFELAVADLFVNKCLEHGFVRFSNPDFTRSVLSEGVGLSADDASELYLLENTESNNDRLHLCGGASIFPFCGFHAKHSVPKHLLPVKYVAAGRRYTPVTGSLPGLYSVNQTTSVQAFVATFGEEELYNEFESCVTIFSSIFCSLGMKFNVVRQPPHLFKNWESLRVSFQVYSPHEKLFVEVGHISLVNDFISKRLKMCYIDKNEGFLKVLSGTVVNTQTLLALCLERSQNKLFVPDVVKDFMITLK